MVRIDTSSCVASCAAVSLPRFCSSRTMASSRSARIAASLPAPTDNPCQARGPSVPDMTNTDFHWLVGQWTSRQRRLTKVLDNCDEWYEFEATLDCQAYLDGNGVFDVLRAPERDIEGLTLRLYDP